MSDPCATVRVNAGATRGGEHAEYDDRAALDRAVRRGAGRLHTAELHRSQTRKGEDGIPYIGHLLSVSSLVIEAGGSQTQAIAALTHDAVEDQGGPPTLAAIKSRFGPEVAKIVSECSDTDEVPKPPWEARKQRYI